MLVTPGKLKSFTRHRVTSLCHKGQQEAAQTGIHVDRNVVRASQCGDFVQWVDDAMRITGTGADQQNRVLVDQLFHCPHTDFERPLDRMEHDVV